jgi:hypothetical protein
MPNQNSNEREYSDRYLNLSGLPVYVYEEDSPLRSVFRKARDCANLPEVKVAFAAVAIGTATQFGVNFDTMKIIADMAMPTVNVFIIAKSANMGAEFLNGLRKINFDVQSGTISRSRYYFDRMPEGSLNSEKPRPDRLFGSFGLRGEAAFMTCLNLVVPAYVAASVLQNLPSANGFGLAISTAISTPFIANATRYGRVALGQWDLTDKIPPKQKKPAPEKARESNGQSAPALSP